MGSWMGKCSYWKDNVMETIRILIIILLITNGSFLVFENEIKIKENNIFFKTEWGAEDNQLYFEDMNTGVSWIPHNFFIEENLIVINQQNQDTISEVKFFNTKNDLIYIEHFDKLKSKYGDKYSYYTIFSNNPLKENLNIIVYIEDNSGNLIRNLLLKLIPENQSLNILNENISKNKFGEKSFINVTDKGESFINQNGDMNIYNGKGKFIGEIKNPKIMYTDKYGRIYIREDVNRVGIYNIKNERTAYFEVPPEIGAEFNIDGGDVDSYLYQWKLDTEENRQYGEYRAMIDLYKLEIDRSSGKWYMYYKGYVTLGVCGYKGLKSRIIKNKVYDKMNYIDGEKGLLQIDPDGTIYHDERDENEFRIIKKKIEK